MSRSTVPIWDSRTGEKLSAQVFNSGALIWDVPNPLYFKVLDHHSRAFNRDQDVIHLQMRFNHRLRKVLGLHKCFISIKVWTTLQPQTWRFLRVFKFQVLKYLDNLGVISINSLVRAINHVLYDVLDGTLEVLVTDVSIMENIY
ncbi:replication enhancement protein [Parsley yellow leaf curl virus]|nr:replication enhancement protein [Parsley yellow leaf curl virus]